VNLQRLEELEAHIDAFTSKIAQEAVGRPDVKLLMGFTGIDYYSAMLIASEIGDVKRFPSAKKLVRYAGLAPGTRQSVDKTIHGHIVKEGQTDTMDTRRSRAACITSRSKTTRLLLTRHETTWLPESDHCRSP
jgi:transposase